MLVKFIPDSCCLVNSTLLCAGFDAGTINSVVFN